MIKAAIYPRVSTSRQEREGYSIGEQIERMKQYCAAMGWTVYHVYTDAGYSGGNMDRPGLQAMLADIDAGKVDKVVVYKLDRLSRSQLDTLYLIEKVFMPKGVDFVSISENFSTGTPFGRATIGLLATFAQLEKDQIRERMTMGKDARIRDGYWIGTVAPMGYDYDKQTKQLVINEEEAAQVREMFALFLDGVPLRDIETRFAESGYTLRGKPWRLFSIRYMIDNMVYAGYIRSRDGWVRGKHEPIVTEETWNAAHKRMETNRLRFAEYNVQTNGDRHSTLLGGMVYCKRCGARYGKRWEGNGDHRYSTYCCYSRMKTARQMVKDPNCRNKTYRVENLDRIVLDEISKLSAAPDAIDKMAKKRSHTDPAAQKSAIEKQMQKIDKQISRFMDLYGLGRFSVEQLDEKVIPLEEQRDQLAQAFAAIDDAPDGITKDEAVAVINSFADAVEHGNRQELRAIIEALIDRIDIDGEDIYISWRFV